MAGRVRGVSCNRRIELAWQVSSDGHTWREAKVPGTAASASGWTWDDRRAFDREEWSWRATIPHGGVLCFDGIATLAEVTLNGETLFTSDNMFVAHEIAIPSGGELVIHCRSLEAELAKKRPRPRWRVPMLEQQQLRHIRTTLLGRTPGWSPPCPAVGPWRPVWLEERKLRVGDVAVTVAAAGTIDVAAELEVDRATLLVSRVDTAPGGEEHDEITGSFDRWSAPLAFADGRWRGRVTVPKPSLWWPHTHGTPAQYALAIETVSRGERAVIDLGTTGFRTIEVDRGAGEDFAVFVNGVRVFCRGACWTPLDVISLASAPEAYDAAIAQACAAGMNMLRVGGTMVYEDDAFYDALDAHGVLLWQDFMFANMDYPEDDAFTASVAREVDQQLARLQARPAFAIACGNSEGEQQAAMSGAGRERWSPALFHERIPAQLAARCPGVPYTPSSTHGGAFPHQPSAGPSSYYGVGAYLRPLDDARRAEVRFASECLAFANIGDVPPGVRVHHAAWKARSPRDLGAGWDFDDVRDHYVQQLFGVDPVALRVSDHERYLALGRLASGEVMAHAFGEWRRARGVTRGGLIWFLRDLWPGAGWGVVDAGGRPKLAWYALRRALQPTAIAITDEGCNGLAVHVANDGPMPLAAQLELTLFRGGQVEVGRGTTEVRVAPHAALELPAAALFEGFLDLSFAYRFGRPTANVVRAALVADGRLLAEAFHFPVGPPIAWEPDVGLTAALGPDGLTVSAKRFAYGVVIDLPGLEPADNGFHLAPGQVRTIALKKVGPTKSGTVTCASSEASVRVEVGRA